MPRDKSQHPLKQYKCPICGSVNSAKCIYGYPEFNDETKALLAAGKAVWCGDMVAAFKVNGKYIDADATRRCKDELLQLFDIEPQAYQKHLRRDQMLNLKVARISTGLTQAKMSELMEIPIRTLQHWENGTRQCPPWAEKLIIAELARIREQNNMIEEFDRVKIKSTGQIGTLVDISPTEAPWYTVELDERELDDNGYYTYPLIMCKLEEIEKI